MMHEKVVQFIEFCEEKPTNMWYDWDSSVRCALGQFDNFDSTGWLHDFETCNFLASEYPHEFGPLAQRVRTHFNVYREYA